MFAAWRKYKNSEYTYTVAYSTSIYGSSLRQLPAGDERRKAFRMSAVTIGHN